MGCCCALSLMAGFERWTHAAAVAAQVMVTKEAAEGHGGLKALVPTGTSILVKGTIEKPPEGAKQVSCM